MFTFISLIIACRFTSNMTISAPMIKTIASPVQNIYYKENSFCRLKDYSVKGIKEYWSEVGLTEQVPAKLDGGAVRQRRRGGARRQPHARQPQRPDARSPLARTERLRDLDAHRRAHARVGHREALVSSQAIYLLVP